MGFYLCLKLLAVVIWWKIEAEGVRGFWDEGNLLIIWQTGRCLQCWRIQGVDLDSVCVVSDQCASANRLVVLNTRRAMTKANDSGSGLWKEGNVCYAPTLETLYVPHMSAMEKIMEHLYCELSARGCQILPLQMSSWYAQGITVFVSSEISEQIRRARELRS